MARRPRRTPAPPAEAAVPAIDFRALVESLCDIVYVLDLEGRFVYLNPRAHDAFGYDRDDHRFIGRPFHDILAPGSAAAAVEAMRRRVRFPLDGHVFRIDGRH